jgi:SSS family solute:Na+ symporter
MSIAAANLFTRDIYRVYVNPHADPAQETRVSKIASLTVKVGALLVIALLNTQFAIDLQLIGGVVILQTLPALAIGLRSSWPHRHALAAGLVAGLATGLALLYQVPQLGGADGRTVIRPHFGGSAWPLSNLGLDTDVSIYAGLLALAVNLFVVAVATPLLRLVGVADGDDATAAPQYVADEGDAKVSHMTDLLDGENAGEVPPPADYPNLLRR